MPSPDRYTNRVWYLGANSEVVTLNGAWFPITTGSAGSFAYTGAQWVTSSGQDPAKSLYRWMRLGTRLTYKDEAQTLTSCNIIDFGEKWISGIPRNQAHYYSMKLKVGID